MTIYEFIFPFPLLIAVQTQLGRFLAKWFQICVITTTMHFQILIVDN